MGSITGGLKVIGDSELVAKLLSQRAGPFEVLIQNIVGTNKLHLSVKGSFRGRTFETKEIFSKVSLEQGSEVEVFDAFEVTVKRLSEENAKKFWEGHKVDYPDARAWMVVNLKGLLQLLDPATPIPGWAWPKWNNAHPGQKAVKDGGVVTITLGSDIQIHKAPSSTESGMAKKFKIVKPVTRQRQVRKPRCPQHNNEMTFNQVDQKWHCTERGCVITATPKREAEAGRVTLGMGKVTARYMLVPDDTLTDISPRVVLVSDDNVALDITEFIDMERLEREWGIEETIQEIKKAGRDSTSLPQKMIPIVMPMQVLGVTNIE